MILEVGIVPLVCERATEEDLADLDAICKRADQAVRDKNYTMDMSLEFHTRVAAATHNPAVSMLIDSFRGPILMSLDAGQEHRAGDGALGTKEHKRFVEAVRMRDAQAASSIMTEHLTRTANRLGH